MVDGKPINVYTPAMRFKPNSLEEVKYTLFQDALVLPNDGLHAFYQCKCSKQQSLRNCIKFDLKSLDRVVTCCFTTVFY